MTGDEASDETADDPARPGWRAAVVALVVVGVAGAGAAIYVRGEGPSAADDRADLEAALLRPADLGSGFREAPEGDLPLPCGRVPDPSADAAVDDHATAAVDQALAGDGITVVVRLVAFDTPLAADDYREAFGECSGAVAQGRVAVLVAVTGPDPTGPPGLASGSALVDVVLGRLEVEG